MSRLTPFFCMTVSSSLATSSNVKPYCRPEQPPPVTNTRSFSSLLPSSSIRAFTLLAALSVKRSGSGIAVAMSFMMFLQCDPDSVGATRVGLELDDLFALLRAFVNQLAHHDRPDVDLDRFIRDISCDTRLGQEFDVLRAAHRARHRAVDHHVRDVDVALDLGQLRDDKRARFVARGLHIALHVPVDPQPAGEDDVAFDGGAGADEAVDRARLVGLSEHGNPLQLIDGSRQFNLP